MTIGLNKFENNQIFSEGEAWTLFSLSAIAEAVGWTLLIVGIILSRYVFPTNQFPVQLAGRIHGLLFIAYVFACLGLYPALRWSYRKTLVALIASVLPYGSLLFEIWASQVRTNQEYEIFKNCLAFSLLASTRAQSQSF